MSEVFVCFPPITNNSIIIGSNQFVGSRCKEEILYFSPTNEGTTKCQSIEVIPEKAFAYILNGTSGSNEKRVSISTLFVDINNGRLSALDLTRLALERADSADKATDVISQLINEYNQDGSIETSPKFGFFICDTKEAFLMNIVGSLWACEKITEGFRAFGKGISVMTKIDKMSEDLEEKLKQLGLSGDFSSAFSSINISDVTWPAEEPKSDFTAQKMFEILRHSSAQSGNEISSSYVSVLKEPISVHWFTGTPNPNESVFKPFIFTSNAKISPVTAIKNGDNETLLRKLHATRKWDEVGELLKTLEKSCVDELEALAFDSAPTSELDELLKDCVESELKFYR